MSFFFDVWTAEGFVLASDVKLTGRHDMPYLHKIFCPPSTSKVVWAAAVCGELPETCNHFLAEATGKDTLREVAHHFARRWTDRYADTQDYSAVHIVGFEQVPNSAECVPQVWYWRNWTEGKGFLSADQLNAELASFSVPIPKNNHLPEKVEETFGKPPSPTLEEERLLTMAFLRLCEPVFSWNGDTGFWRSAAGAVGSAMNLLWRRKSQWPIEDTAKLAKTCLEFLANAGEFLPDSTVGLSADAECDVVMVTPEGVKSLVLSKLP